MLDLGMALVYYTDLRRGSFKIRPEPGAGMGRTRVVMGFNIPAPGNGKFTALKNNLLQLSIQTAIGIDKKIKRL